MAIKNLPVVVEENEQYRLVAVRQTAQAESVHALKHVVQVLDEGANVEVVAEKKHVDALGNSSWNSCSIDEAKNAIFKDKVNSLLKVSEEKKSSLSKKQEKLIDKANETRKSLKDK